MSRLRDEAGVALVTAILLLGIMVTGGVATLEVVDVQTSESATERHRESAFNLAESALSAQIFLLARDWPGRGSAASPYPSCTPQTAGGRCPAADQVAGSSASPDLAAGASWTTEVHDNGGSAGADFYADETSRSQPGYDANGDGEVWVRSAATAEGRTRTLVALVRAEEQTEYLTQAAVVAGRLTISNNGNKTIIDGTAATGASVPTVGVRCVPTQSEALACLGHRLGSGGTQTLQALMNLIGRQVAPAVTRTNLPVTPGLAADARERLRARAIADGTYWTSCPPSLTGKVVWIAAGSCSYTGNETYNSPDAPGLVVLEDSTLYLGGTTSLHSVVHHVNDGGSSADLVQVQGNAQVFGGILIDGHGGLIAGSSKVNVVFDPNAFTSVASYSSAGIIQNTWREVRP